MRSPADLAIIPPSSYPSRLLELFMLTKSFSFGGELDLGALEIT